MNYLFISDRFNLALINWLQVYPLLYSMCHWAMEIHSIHFLKLNIKILIKLFLCCYCSKYFYSVFLYFFIFAFSEYLPFLISFASNLLWISCFSGFRFKINTTFLSQIPIFIKMRFSLQLISVDAFLSHFLIVFLICFCFNSN